MNLFFQKNCNKFLSKSRRRIIFLRIILSDDELCFCPYSDSLQRRSLDYMHAQRYKKGHQSSVYSSRLLHEPASVLQQPAASNISPLLPILPSTHISCYFIAPYSGCQFFQLMMVQWIHVHGKFKSNFRYFTESCFTSVLCLEFRFVLDSRDFSNFT